MRGLDHDLVDPVILRHVLGAGRREGAARRGSDSRKGGEVLRTNRAIVFALVLGFLAIGGLPGAQGAPAVTDPTTHLRMPFTGWFDKYGFSPPGSHFTSGDWSTDLYAPPPTTVKAWIQIPSGGTTTLKVLSVGTTPSLPVAGA